MAGLLTCAVRVQDVLRVFGDGGAKGARAAPQLAQGNTAHLALGRICRGHD